MPLIKPFAELPLMKIRNVKVDLSLSRRINVVRSTGLPAKTDPTHFVKTMLDWESRIGTTHAALAGMMIMSDATEIDNIIDGFETFHRIYDQVIPFIQNRTVAELEQFTEFLKGKLRFVPFTPNFHLGLKSFEANLNGEDKIVGDCVVCAAIYALLYSLAGKLAGAGTRVGDLHTQAYLHSDKLVFDAGQMQKKVYINLTPLSPKSPYIYSSVFSFLTLGFLMAVMPYVRNKLPNNSDMKFLAPDDAAFVLNWLECAEAINPYHLYLYFNKQDLYKDLGREVEAAQLDPVISELMVLDRQHKVVV